MAYKVLNNISVKDTSSSKLAGVKTDMLVLIINKGTKNDSSFKELDAVSNKYLSKTITSHLKDAGSSIILPKMNGIAAENLSLIHICRCRRT